LWDLLERGGKRWRPMLGLMIGKYLNQNIEDYKECKTLYSILGCVEILHNATLMIDDVVDKSEFRRSKPCTHVLFGNGIALNAGIGLLYYPVQKAMGPMEDLEKGKFLKNYLEEMSAILFGQTIDYEMNAAKRLLEVSNYVDTVLCKTGVFPRMMVKMIYDLCADDFARSQTKAKMLNIMNLMSIAFQIEDDLLNIEENELSKNKGILGEDIYEGKLTLMVIKAVQNLSKDKSNRLREILYMKTKDPSLIKEAILLLKSGGGTSFAIEYMTTCIKDAKKLCQELPCENQSSQEAVNEIIQLFDYLIKRNV